MEVAVEKVAIEEVAIEEIAIEAFYNLALIGELKGKGPYYSYYLYTYTYY